MPHSTWRFTVKYKIKKDGSTRMGSFSKIQIQVQSHQNWPTEIEKIKAITNYIEQRYGGEVVELDIIDCDR